MEWIFQYSGPASLAVENLGCDRGGDPIVRGVSFSLAPGEAIQLFGRNGSGKSSFLYTVGGLIKPAEGRFIFRIANAAIENPSMLFLGHETGAKPALTAFENLSFWARASGAPNSQETINLALKLWGLADLRDVRVAMMSAGQRRRVDLCRLLILNRSIWLLDEPATALDPAAAKLLSEIIDRHLFAGGIVIAATHEQLDFQSRRLEIG